MRRINSGKAVAVLIGLVLAPGVQAQVKTGSSKSEAPLAADASSSEESKMQSRPFRVDFMSLNSQMDRDKPLAAEDFAGWTLNSGILIGQFDERWVGGLQLPGKTASWWYDGRLDMTAPPGSFGSSVVLGFRDGRIAKLEALTGKQLWAVEVDSFVARPFLLSGTTLYAVTAAQVLYALDFQTGKTLWLYDGGFPAGLLIHGAARPIMQDNKVIFGLDSGEIQAIGAGDGKLVWRYNPAYSDARFHDIIGEMVIRNNRLIISRYDGLVAGLDLGPSQPTVVWKEQLPAAATSAYRGGRYYVGGVNGDVYAYDADTGRRIWRVVTGAPVTSITAGERTLFVGAADGQVTALDLADGKIQWYDRVGASLMSSPVLFEDIIYFTTGLKSLYGYRIR